MAIVQFPTSLCIQSIISVYLRTLFICGRFNNVCFIYNINIELLSNGYTSKTDGAHAHHGTMVYILAPLEGCSKSVDFKLIKTNSLNNNTIV